MDEKFVVPEVIQIPSVNEYLDTQVKQASENWALSLCKLLLASRDFVEQVFTEQEEENYKTALSILAGADQKKYQILFKKLTAAQKEDYIKISDYKNSEAVIHNEKVKMQKSVDAITISLEAKKLIATK